MNRVAYFNIRFFRLVRQNCATSCSFSIYNHLHPVGYLYRSKYQCTISLHTSPIRYFAEHLSELEFDKICNETLESLSEFFEYLIEEFDDLKGADVTYSDGVLTISLGEKGTYVINRQTPNKQIWLSSPYSGPKRYDLVNKKLWIYKRDNQSLHKLLQKELSQLLNKEINLSGCLYSQI